MPLSTGQVLNNRYRIVKLLGQGGFGAVYRAWDLNLKRPFALKENLDLSPESIRQFEREATFLAELHHPNLPRVIDCFLIPEQGQYLVMDFIEGQTLEEKLEQAGGPLLEAQVVPWIVQVCDALTFLHDQNPPVIHRDVKPANIKITPEGKAVLVDFGIAKAYFGQMQTTIGARAVTEGYSPPEQYGYGITDVRSDVYALGATLYHALTSQRPVESVRRSIDSNLVPLRKLNPGVSPRVEAAVLKAMAVDAERRHQTAQEFKKSLETPVNVLTPPGTRAQAVRQVPRTAIADTLISTPSPPPSAPSKVVSPKPVKRTSGGLVFKVGLVFLGVMSLLAVVLGGLYAFFGDVLYTATPTPSATLVLPTDTLTATTEPTSTPTPSPTLVLTLPPPSWTPTLTASPTLPPTPTATPTAELGEWTPCPDTYSSRLHVDDLAYVSYFPPLKNNVRANPNLGASLVGTLDPGEEMQVIEGPVCANNMIWWKIRALDTSLTGWTSEGDMEHYWLVPLTE